MPTGKLAEKQVRVSKRKHLRNKTIKSAVKTKITTAETLISSGKVEAAREAAVVAITSLDKAAEKKIIHPNNAARRKSRLAKKLNRALASTVATKPEAAA